jgi:hypothetical protein
MADNETLPSPTSIQSADDALMQSASQRHLAAHQELSPYGSSASSEVPPLEQDSNNARTSNISTPFEFESVVPFSPPLEPREDGYDILALDPSRSIDLVANLEESTPPPAAGLTQGSNRDGYLSDTQVERVAGSHLEEPPYLPGMMRGRPRRRGRAALKNALAMEGTIAPGQPGLVRRVRDKEMNVELFDQYSEEVRVLKIGCLNKIDCHCHHHALQSLQQTSAKQAEHKNASRNIKKHKEARDLPP